MSQVVEKDKKWSKFGLGFCCGVLFMVVVIVVICWGG